MINLRKWLWFKTLPIKRWWWRKKYPNPKYWNYEEYSGWGCHITWWKEGTKVYGHLQKKPNVGDILRCKMESGKTGLFRFTDIQNEMDPPDMFWGDVHWVGYQAGKSQSC